MSVTSSTKTVALVGNPNAGKSLLINALAGARLHVGNWPGVTVEKKEATLSLHGIKIRLVDLPGMYSLDVHTQEEKIASDFLLQTPPDLIINVIDVNALERGLFLTTQLIDQHIPVIVVLNMEDELLAKGQRIDQQKISETFGVPVLTCSAKTHKGVGTLRRTLEQQLHHPTLPTSLQYESPSGRGATLGSIEERYALIGKVCTTSTLPTSVSPRRDGSLRTMTENIDRVVLSKYLGIPFFFFILYIIFKLTFDGSAPFVDWIGKATEFFAGHMRELLSTAGVPLLLNSLLVDGILRGVGLVLTFLPLLTFFYFFFALLEESGYMPRAAFVIDRVMRSFGLHGRAFIALLVGFGCNVPGVYATRTLQDDNDRKLTSLLLSFMSCGAKLPIYAFFTAIFFTQNQAIVILSLYSIGMAVAVLWGIVLHKTVFRGILSPFILEIPPYRIPTLKMLTLSVWAKVKAYLKGAGTIIPMTMVIVWALLHLPYGAPQQDTLMGRAGQIVAPIFVPLGFGNQWQSVAAILPGFVAKEVVVGALGQLYGEAKEEATVPLKPFWEGAGELVIDLGSAFQEAGFSLVSNVVPHMFSVDKDELQDSTVITRIRESYTPLSAFSFMVFNLLLVSCVASMGAIVQEFGKKHLLYIIGLTVFTAYSVSCLVFTLGKIIGFS